MAAPFEFTEIQAEHILDMQLAPAHPARPRTSSRRSWSELRATIAELEAILGDDGRAARTVIKDELAEIRAELRRRAPHARSPSTPATSTSRTSSTTRSSSSRCRPRATSRRSRPTRSAPRAAAAAACAGAKLRDEDYVEHILTTTAHAYLLFFSNRGRVYRLQGPRDPDEGAHRAGHGHRQPAAAPARRAHPGDHRHARLRDQPVPVLRHHARAR